VVLEEHYVPISPYQNAMPGLIRSRPIFLCSFVVNLEITVVVVVVVRWWWHGGRGRDSNFPVS